VVGIARIVSTDLTQAGAYVSVLESIVRRAVKSGQRLGFAVTIHLPCTRAVRSFLDLAHIRLFASKVRKHVLLLLSLLFFSVSLLLNFV
jgi:hypothetical protein